MLWRVLGVMGFLIGVSGNIHRRYIRGVLVVTQLLVCFFMDETSSTWYFHQARPDRCPADGGHED